LVIEINFIKITVIYYSNKNQVNLH
jgi:hypothetical protein